MATATMTAACDRRRSSWRNLAAGFNDAARWARTWASQLTDEHVAVAYDDGDSPAHDRRP